jgi:glycosyltransferase involved in cell wall biosynthesis
MLIGIDASRATSATPTGTETYSRELIRALIALDRKNQYRLYTRESVSPEFFADSESSRNTQHATRTRNYELRSIPFPRLWTHLRLSYEMLTHAPNVLFVPGHVLPLIHPRRSIVTIHDLGHLRFPEAHPPRQRLYHTWATQWNARSASHIFADSEATRDDIVELCHIAPEKISVIYPAFDARMYQPVRDAEKIKSVREKYRLGSDYILAIGTLHPRKNYARLIEAFAQIATHHASRITLVIVGKKGWLYQPILDRIQSLHLQSQVSFLDYVPGFDMPALISGARMLAFPSLHEGFGLPVLEAQACGTPVVTSMTSSLPEAAGDAALMVDPLDVDAITGTMQRLLTDESLRTHLIARGFDNIKRFSWQVSARQALDVINALGD